METWTQIPEIRHHRGPNRRRWCVLTAMTSLLMTLQANAYNVDVENAKIIRGPVNGSHFGFSAFLHRTTGGAISLVVGAPLEDGGNGSLYDYSLQALASGSQEEPRPRKVHTILSNVRLVNKWNDTNMHGEMYGFYVGGSSRQAMVCAPRWADVFNADNSYQLLGRCAFYNADVTAPLAQASQEPLYSKNNIGYYEKLKGRYETFNAQAELGLAADLTPDGTAVVGLPGRAAWSGGFMTSDVADNHFRDSHSGIDDDLPFYSYLGYAVSVAAFCRAPRFCIAAGAPRYELRGGAFVYEKMGSSYTLLANVTGDQLGAYFGATVLGMDVDIDGEVELLVGAPYHTADRSLAATDRKTRFADEGRVFVYKNTRPQVTGELQYKLVTVLEGSNAAHARFGSSMSDIGDVNADGFQDLGVGAPQEDEGRGALYVYHGGAGGLQSTPTQRISASALHPDLRGFGGSLTKPLDLDDNTYPDLAVGSHMSDSVVVLRTRPILDLVARLEVLPPLIVPNDTRCSAIAGTDGCFLLQLCFSYSGPALPRFVVVAYGLSLDTQAKRAKRIGVQEGQRARDMISGNTTVFKDVFSCLNFTAVSFKAARLRDPFTLVRVEGQFSLNQPVLPPGNLQPVTNASRPTTVQAEAAFSSGCRKQTVCDADLKLQMAQRFLSGETFITINQTRLMEVDLLLRNTGEVAYSATVDFDWTGSDIRFLDVRASLPDNRLDRDVGTEESQDVKWRFLQQVSQGDALPFTVILNATGVNPLQPNVTLTAMARTISNELTQPDNLAQLVLPVWVVANASLTGLSSPTGVGVPVTVVKAAGEPVVEEVAHTYTVINRGPSYLPSPTLQLAVPYYTLEGVALLTDAMAEIKMSDGSSRQCLRTLPLLDDTPPGGVTSASVEGSTSVPSMTSGRPSQEPDVEDETGRPVITLPPQDASRRRRSPDGSHPDNRQAAVQADVSGQGHLTCATAQCAVFECHIRSLDPAASVSVNLTLSVDLAALPLHKESGSLWLESEGTLLQPDHPRLLPWGVNITSSVATRFDPVFRETVAIWIIIVAALGGLLLLIVLGAIFWRLGFFKREKKERVEQWKRQSTIRKSMADRRSMMPDKNGKEPGPDL